MFELNEEVAKELELNEEQVSKINEFGKNVITDYQKEVDNSLKEKGNTYAEGILSGAVKPTEEATGIQREKGEKIADFFKRAGETYLPQKLSQREKEIESLKNDYEEKIKGVKDGSKLKEELDSFKQKVAELEPLSEFKDKFEEVNSKYISLRDNTAFDKSMPKIPESINEYEKKAKISNVKKEILANFDIQYDDDGVPFAVDKENDFKKQKLSDLLQSNETIKSMIDSADDGKNSKGKGFDGKPHKTYKIDGVPFEVPKDADVNERSRLIADHLTKKGVSKSSDEWKDSFSLLNAKILKAQAK